MNRITNSADTTPTPPNRRRAKHSDRRLLIACGLLLVGSVTACAPASPGYPNPATTFALASEATAPAPTVTVTHEAPPVTTTETTTAAPPIPLTVTRRPPAPRPTTAPSPSFPPDAEIRTETAGAFDVVNTYWSNLFASWPGEQGEPIQWWTPALYHGDGFYDSARGSSIDCGGTPSPINASFCSNGYGSGTVSWDLELFRQEELFGDGPIYAVVAHEVGHAAQARFLYDDEGGASPPPWDTVHTELQADCLAGATLAKAEQDGYLTVEPGDLDEISASTRAFNEGGGDHGSADQRIAAFEKGYGGDIESCLYNQGVPPN